MVHARCVESAVFNQVALPKIARKKTTPSVQPSVNATKDRVVVYAEKYSCSWKMATEDHTHVARSKLSTHNTADFHSLWKGI